MLLNCEQNAEWLIPTAIGPRSHESPVPPSRTAAASRGDAEKWALPSQRYSLQLTEIPSVGRRSAEFDLNKKASRWCTAARLWHSCLQHCTKAEKLKLGHVGFLPTGHTRARARTHAPVNKCRSDRLHNLAEFCRDGLAECSLSAAGGGSAASSRVCQARPALT